MGRGVRAKSHWRRRAKKGALPRAIPGSTQLAGIMDAVQMRDLIYSVGEGSRLQL
jgi:hypothetical protein